MKSLFKVVPLFLFFSGCATTSNIQKPVMDQAEYESRALRYAHLGTCLRLGYMDSSTHGKAMSISQRGGNMRFSNIDNQKLDEMTREAGQAILENVQLMSNEERNDFKHDCQVISGMVETNYNEIQEKERNNSLQKPNIIYSQPAQNKSSTTYCNKFGSQVICNSY